MFIPIGDTPNPPGTPWVTYGLIGLNVAVFVLLTLPLSATPAELSDPLLVEYLQRFAVPSGHLPSAYDLQVFRFGYRPAEPGVIPLFSSMFLHAGWGHLLGNMLFLWIYGDNVEYRLGRVGFLAAYLLTGIASALFFGLFSGDPHIPMIGASGAISGVLGFYFVWFKRNQVKVFLLFFPFLMHVILVPARIVLGVYLVLGNLLPFLTSAGEGGGVAYGAHIGGFIAGALAAWLLDRKAGVTHRLRRQAMRSPEPETVRRAEAGLSPRQVIAAHLRRGDYPGAVRHYVLLDGRRQRRELSADTILALGEYLLGTGAWPEAITLFRRFIAERPGDPEVDRAYLGAGKALFNLPRERGSAYQYFLSAVDTADSPGLADEARRYLRRLEQSEN